MDALEGCVGVGVHGKEKGTQTTVGVCEHWGLTNLQSSISLDSLPLCHGGPMARGGGSSVVVMVVMVRASSLVGG